MPNKILWHERWNYIKQYVYQFSDKQDKIAKVPIGIIERVGNRLYSVYSVLLVQAVTSHSGPFIRMAPLSFVGSSELFCKIFLTFFLVNGAFPAYVDLELSTRLNVLAC